MGMLSFSGAGGRAWQLVVARDIHTRPAGTQHQASLFFQGDFFFKIVFICLTVTILF